MLRGFKVNGKASFVVGGQWGSEGKGGSAAVIAKTLAERGDLFTVVTTNAGAQAGHTSIHNGKKRVVYHLPTAPFIARDILGDVKTHHQVIYLNAGSVIDPDVLLNEIREQQVNESRFFIHPNAAIITDECKAAEGRVDSAQTKIASTRKGVGEALARKALRSGLIARDHPILKNFVRRIPLNEWMDRGHSVLVEVPQGFSLSVNGKFYPACTSRHCTIQQAMADADIHPSYLQQVMMIIRTYPIRVGHIFDNEGQKLGDSGGIYPDQKEVSWANIGVEAEITTVTKRVRRVFTFSQQQLRDAMEVLRPDVIHLTFCDYFKDYATPELLQRICDAIVSVSKSLKRPVPEMLYQFGPTTNDVFEEQDIPWTKDNWLPVRKGAV